MVNIRINNGIIINTQPTVEQQLRLQLRPSALLQPLAILFSPLYFISIKLYLSYQETEGKNSMLLYYVHFE